MKKFVLYWNKKSYAEDYVEIHDQTYFTFDNGYEPENLIAIEALEVGNTSILDNGYHIVLRVE